MHILLRYTKCIQDPQQKHAQFIEYTITYIRKVQEELDRTYIEREEFTSGGCGGKNVS